MDKKAFNKLHSLAAKEKDAEKELTSTTPNKEMIEDSKIVIKKESKDKEEMESGAMPTPMHENRIWKCVSGADQIRKVVEHLGEDGENLDRDLELRNNLVTSLLSDRKVADSSGMQRERERERERRGMVWGGWYGRWI